MTERVPWDCQRDGHDWRVIPTGADQPQIVQCFCCGELHAVNPYGRRRQVASPCIVSGIGHEWQVGFDTAGKFTGLLCLECREEREPAP